MVDQETKTLEGRCVAAGGKSRDLLARLLGVEDTRGQFSVRAVAWLDRALEASVPTPGGEELVFRIERRTPDAAGLVVTDTLVLYFRGQAIPDALLEAVQAHAPGRLAGHTLESLSERLGEDPELGDPALPMPPGRDEEQRPRSLLDTWGEDSAYADFFAGGELARAQLDSLDPGALFSFVQHSDCECLHVNPHGGGPVVWLVNYPWDDRIRHGTSTTERQDLATAASEGMITTDLNEDDVIMGNPDKLRRALAQAERVHRRSGKTLFISNTCTPVVTGEDVESEVKRFAERTRIPLLYLTVTPRSMVNVFHEVLVDRRLAAERDAAPARQRSVNLIGFRSGPEVAELEGLLGELDVSVNCCLLPDLTLELVDGLPRGALNVFMPNQLWQHLYDQLQFSSRIPGLSPPAPYGRRQTLAWAEQIGEHFGIDDAGRRRLRERADGHRPALERAWEQAGAHRLAFVIRAGETHLLTRPAATWGVPLVGMLEEAGFALEVYIRVRDKQTARRAAQEVNAAFGAPDRHKIQAFKTRQGMEDRLRDSAAQAVFSSHFFDWRVTSSGKNLFSLQHFEMGLQGALHTVHRLVGICRTPFYRRYQRFLKRSAEGLRADPAAGEDP